MSEREARSRSLLGLDLGHRGPEPLPVLRRRLLVAGALLLLGLALTVTVATGGGRAAVQRVDDRFYDLMAALRWGPLVGVSDLLDVAFGTVVSWPLPALVTLVLVLRRRWLALRA